MNTELIDTLAQIIESLSPEEKNLLQAKIQHQQTKLSSEEEPPFYERATKEEWIKTFQEWAESHSRDTPLLSDEAISRESIYGDRG